MRASGSHTRNSRGSAHALPAHVRAVNPGLLDDIARKEFLLDDAAAELSAIIADYVSKAK